MRPAWFSASDHLYRRLLGLYPAAFRQRYAAEMAQVFRSLSRRVHSQAGAGGMLRLWLRTLWDLGWGALVQWWQSLSRVRMVNMNANPIDQADGTVRLTLPQAALAVLPFVLYGVASVLSKPYFFRSNPLIPALQAPFTSPYFVFYLLGLVGLGAALVAGFPRWGFSYLGWTLYNIWWWSDLHYNGRVWVWEIWLPLLAALILPLLIRRSFKPLRPIGAGLWKDLTLYPFGFYVLYAAVYMMFDENHHPQLRLFIALTTVVVSLGAYGFFTSTSPMRRVLALLGGIFAAAILSGISYATWDYATYYNLPQGPEGADRINLVGLAWIIGITLVVLGLGFLTQWRQRRASQ
jgi:hypothetical protein